MPPEQLPAPWHLFFADVDDLLREPVELHCFGGFVVTMLYGAPRLTSDVDVFLNAPGNVGQLPHLAGKGSALHHRHGVYLDFVAIASVPEDYEERLTEMFPGAFRYLRLLAFDPYDVALAKLERNLQRDRDDVKHLARIIPFDFDVLRERYEKELRPLLGNPAREDLTLQLWLEALAEEQNQ